MTILHNCQNHIEVEGETNRNGLLLFYSILSSATDKVDLLCAVFHLQNRKGKNKNWMALMLLFHMCKLPIQCALMLLQTVTDTCLCGFSLFLNPVI